MRAKVRAAGKKEAPNKTHTQKMAWNVMHIKSRRIITCGIRLLIPAANGIYVNKFLKRKDVRYGSLGHYTLPNRAEGAVAWLVDWEGMPLLYDPQEPLSSVCLSMNGKHMASSWRLMVRMNEQIGRMICLMPSSNTFTSGRTAVMVVENGKCHTLLERGAEVAYCNVPRIECVLRERYDRRRWT